MIELWKQFSLFPPGCKNRFQPMQVLHRFIPTFLEANPQITMWHVLFEPSALVRVQAPYFDGILQSAMEIANACGLTYCAGDCSAEWNSEIKYPGEDYGGEAEAYGAELWEANKKYMQSCSALAVQLLQLPHDRQVWMYRKFSHLYCNALGFNFLEEAAAYGEWAENAMARYRQLGRS